MHDQKGRHLQGWHKSEGRHVSRMGRLNSLMQARLSDLVYDQLKVAEQFVSNSFERGKVPSLWG